MQSEDQLQQSCVVWARNTYPELRGFGIIHVPNGGQKHYKVGMKERSIGAVAGFPDLICIMPNGRIFFVELKTEKGVQGIEQKKCEAFMQERGVEYYLIRTLQDFQKLINSKI